MGRLAQHTINQYRWKLKRLRRVLPFIPQDDPELPKVLNEIEKLTNILGAEMSDLETQLKRGPGRPRTTPDVSVYEKALAEAEAEAPKETAIERKTRVELRAQSIREKYEREHPEVLAERESARQLEEMQKMVQQGGGDEGRIETADEPKPTGSDNK